MGSLTIQTRGLSLVLLLLLNLVATSWSIPTLHYHLHHKYQATSSSAIESTDTGLIHHPFDDHVNHDYYLYGNDDNDLTSSTSVSSKSTTTATSRTKSQGPLYVPNPHQRVYLTDNDATTTITVPSMQYSQWATYFASVLAATKTESSTDSQVTDVTAVLVGGSASSSTAAAAASTSDQGSSDTSVSSKASATTVTTKASTTASETSSAAQSTSTESSTTGSASETSTQRSTSASANQTSSALQSFNSTTSKPFSSSTESSASSTGALSSGYAVPSSAVSAIPPPDLVYASSSTVIVPKAGSSQLLGNSINQPTSQYINWTNPPYVELPDSLLTVGVNGDLSTEYDLSSDTGSLPINDTTRPLITELNAVPHISRDGGKGGYLNGKNLFLFCDTGSYTQPNDTDLGNFLGFVSNSVAVDIGRKGTQGQAVVLEDGIGEWSNANGRMRGFAPLTDGEQSYNIVMQGKGQRYAIWPESSLIPLNQTTALLYAPIIYDNVNMETYDAVFTYTGTTLLTITAPDEGGPIAERVVDKIWYQKEVEWGSIGGLRSYGPAGIGGNDGRVYIFGSRPAGMLIARVDAQKTTDREAYQYWTGLSWTSGMQSLESQAFFLPGAFMDGDIFYSPAHLTFIFIYLNPYADNTFYFKYLMADHAIYPSYAPAGDPSEDYAENLVKYEWSPGQVLYRAPKGPTGMYIYAGGVHQGYFDADDITNGGKKLLLSWTVPTGANPASKDSEYFIGTAEVEFA